MPMRQAPYNRDFTHFMTRKAGPSDLPGQSRVPFSCCLGELVRYSKHDGWDDPCHISATLNRAKLAVVYVFGVWFKIRCRYGMGSVSTCADVPPLRDWPIKMLDLDVLACLGEAIPTPRHGPSWQTKSADEAEEPTHPPSRTVAVLSDQMRPHDSSTHPCWVTSTTTLQKKKNFDNT
jgi:hypothetical protein